MKNEIIEPRHKAISKEIVLKHNEKIAYEDVNSVLSKIFTNFEYAKKLTGGRISGVYKFFHKSNHTVLKYSMGTYRMTELARESRVLKYLNHTEVKDIVPKIRNFEIENKHQFAYLLLDYIEGQTVRQILEETPQSGKLQETWEKVGEAISKIHKLFIKDDENCEWLNNQLKVAETNMINHLIDLEDYGEEDPAELLQWLISNKPKKSIKTIIHGDFRTKNIMVDRNNQIKIIDWGFVDIGDPLYDLAVIDYYFTNDLERESFYKGYSICQYDKDIIDYFDKLSWFINV
ncbi:MAG: aminoglycoside phosphotransferase family protein [Candidatus Izemoplasmatales bacterium]